jgi:threonyl-tRNA synthetase
VGDKEAEAGQVAVREHGRGDRGSEAVDEFIMRLQKAVQARVLSR